jgi:hypothetical protein
MHNATITHMFVTGVDGCRAGWVAFKVDLSSLVTSVEVIDLRALLRKRPPELACLGIDIPIALLDGPERATRLPANCSVSHVAPACSPRLVGWLIGADFSTSEPFLEWSTQLSVVAANCQGKTPIGMIA